MRPSILVLALCLSLGCSSTTAQQEETEPDPTPAATTPEAEAETGPAAGEPAAEPAAEAPAAPAGVTMVGDQCCCMFLREGDIMNEDLRTPEACAAEPSGECIEVDPGRTTPHPCCPDATGERCGS